MLLNIGTFFFFSQNENKNQEILKVSQKQFCSLVEKYLIIVMLKSVILAEFLVMLSKSMYLRIWLRDKQAEFRLILVFVNIQINLES